MAVTPIADLIDLSNPVQSIKDLKERSKTEVAQWVTNCLIKLFPNEEVTQAATLLLQWSITKTVEVAKFQSTLKQFEDGISKLLITAENINDLKKIIIALKAAYQRADAQSKTLTIQLEDLGKKAKLGFTQLETAAFGYRAAIKLENRIKDFENQLQQTDQQDNSETAILQKLNLEPPEIEQILNELLECKTEDYADTFQRAKTLLTSHLIKCAAVKTTIEHELQNAKQQLTEVDAQLKIACNLADQANAISSQPRHVPTYDAKLADELKLSPYLKNQWQQIDQEQQQTKNLLGRMTAYFSSSILKSNVNRGLKNAIARYNPQSKIVVLEQQKANLQKNQVAFEVQIKTLDEHMARGTDYQTKLQQLDNPEIQKIKQVIAEVNDYLKKSRGSLLNAISDFFAVTPGYTKRKLKRDLADQLLINLNQVRNQNFAKRIIETTRQKYNDSGLSAKSKLAGILKTAPQSLASEHPADEPQTNKKTHNKLQLQ